MVKHAQCAADQFGRRQGDLALPHTSEHSQEAPVAGHLCLAGEACLEVLGHRRARPPGPVDYERQLIGYSLAAHQRSQVPGGGGPVR